MLQLHQSKIFWSVNIFKSLDTRILLWRISLGMTYIQEFKEEVTDVILILFDFRFRYYFYILFGKLV